MFNKPSEWTLRDWKTSKAREIMDNAPIDYIDLNFIDDVDMSEEEKSEHPEYTTLGGYLRKKEIKADKQRWWDELPQADKDVVMALPNFDKDAFVECTGIMVSED